MFFVVPVVLCVLVELFCLVVVVLVGKVVWVVPCIYWVGGVWGRRTVGLSVSGTLLLVLGGGCRRLVVVVGCGVGTLPASNNLLVRRDTGRILESFLRLIGDFWEWCCFRTSR